MNKLLIPAARQYMHNNGSGLLFGYDKKLTEEIVDKLEKKIEKLEEQNENLGRARQ
jgi:hypothetical protein